MKEQITGIYLDYGDAVFRIYHICMPPVTDPLPNMHSHRYYELLFSTQEGLLYQFEDGTVSVGSNQILIVPPNTPHASLSKDKEKAGGLCFTLTLQKGRGGFYDAFEQALQRHAKRPIHIPASLLQSLRTLNEGDWSGSLRGYCRLKAAASAFLFSLFEVLDAFSSTERSTGADLEREDIQVLLDNLLQYPSLSLREIAREINYSERHTARLIQKFYQMSFSELRKRQK